MCEGVCESHHCPIIPVSLPGFEVIQSFVEDSEKKYGSEPAPLVSAEEVNQWVADVTEGHMTNFLPSLPSDVVLMLINAMHFKGKSSLHLLKEIVWLKLLPVSINKTSSIF